MKKQEKFQTFLIGLLAGGITGSILALLYAPTSSKKLRRKISDTTEDIIESAEEVLETSKEKTEKLIKEGKKKAAEIIEDAKSKITAN